ncbi:hypothetical protein INR49_023491 [Caranx melampygus]|nr:hypothetical protein INR49_023491 [Caranx melampygus]
MQSTSTAESKNNSQTRRACVDLKDVGYISAAPPSLAVLLGPLWRSSSSSSSRSSSSSSTGPVECRRQQKS